MPQKTGDFSEVLWCHRRKTTSVRYFGATEDNDLSEVLWYHRRQMTSLRSSGATDDRSPQCDTNVTQITLTINAKVTNLKVSFGF